MTPTPTAELLLLSGRATPGPWEWRNRHGQIEVAAPHGGGTVVMGFVRDGMRNAQPVFGVALDGEPRGKRGGVLRAAKELMVADPKGELSHPDALFMVEVVNWFRSQDWATTPKADLPESVVTDAEVLRVLHAAQPGFVTHSCADFMLVQAVIEVVDSDVRAANARAEGWISVGDAKPPEDTPVWCSIDGREPWFGAYCYADGDDVAGWAWMRCDSQPYMHNGKWQCDDIEWDDQYDVTHWKLLPDPPAAQAVRSEASEGDGL